MYLQDKWNIKPTLTLTYGLRYSLLQPPFESSGNQVAPTVDMHDSGSRRAGRTCSPALPCSQT